MNEKDQNAKFSAAEARASYSLQDNVVFITATVTIERCGAGFWILSYGAGGVPRIAPAEMIVSYAPVQCRDVNTGLFPAVEG